MYSLNNTFPNLNNKTALKCDVRLFQKANVCYSRSTSPNSQARCVVLVSASLSGVSWPTKLRWSLSVCICVGMNVHACIKLRCASVWTMQSSKVTDGEGTDGGGRDRAPLRPRCTLFLPILKIRRKGVTPGGHFEVIFCTQSVTSKTSPEQEKSWGSALAANSASGSCLWGLTWMWNSYKNIIS